MRGVQLYRANFIRSLLRPRSRSTHVPVQLIVPLSDRFVRPQLFADLQRWAPLLSRREVCAGHWQLLAEPTALAGWLRGYVSRLEQARPRTQPEQAPLR